MRLIANLVENTIRGDRKRLEEQLEIHLESMVLKDKTKLSRKEWQALSVSIAKYYVGTSTSELLTLSSSR